MTNCKHCNNPVTSNYCAYCGHAASVKPIDKDYVSREVLELLDFEKGFFYTIRELMIRPGKSIRTFISEDRIRLIKPVTFLIFTSLLYTLIAHLFNAEGFFIENENPSVQKSSIGAINNWVQSNYGYANIIMGIFIALCVKLLFRKYKYNLFEIIVLLCFVMGQGMLLLTVQSLFAGLLSTQTFMNMMILVSIIYPTWAIGQFFDETKAGSYVKALFAYILGAVLFGIAVVIVGVTADLLIRMF